MNIYTDPTLLDVAGAMEPLPDLSLEAENQEALIWGRRSRPPVVTDHMPDAVGPACERKPPPHAYSAVEFAGCCHLADGHSAVSLDL
jgi:hypothetical protein